MEKAELKVSGTSNPKSVAGSIVHNIREEKNVEITAMGPNAVNQTMKSIAIAREYISEEGKDLFCKPGFTHIQLDGEEKSAMVFFIFAEEK